MLSGADLRTFLLADAAVAALVSTRVYPVEIPQKLTLPLIRYVQVSGLNQHTTPGTSSLSRARWQVDCLAADYASARALADAVMSRMDAYKGVVGSGTAQGVFAANQADDYVPEMKAFLLSLDFFVWS